MDKITDFHAAALYFIKYTKSIWGIFLRCGRGVYRNFIFQWVGKYIEYMVLYQKSIDFYLWRIKKIMTDKYTDEYDESADNTYDDTDSAYDIVDSADESEDDANNEDDATKDDKTKKNGW